jgi:Domain of unknown function (DUF1905)/Bacteriocin-protection, YdeI or OmpD-Associated
MKSFSARIAKIGINPYVGLSDDVLDALFKQANKTRGPIPIRGTINGKKFKQTLVKYQGAWRLYINGPMRQAAGVDVGGQVHVNIEFDTEPRIEKMHPKLTQALSRNKMAKAAFESLIPSRQKEILRYLNSIKTESSLERNVEKVIQYLLGEQPEGMRALTSRRS